MLVLLLAKMFFIYSNYFLKFNYVMCLCVMYEIFVLQICSTLKVYYLKSISLYHGLSKSADFRTMLSFFGHLPIVCFAPNLYVSYFSL